ncbi:UNVERIFIED_ORG: hypothetical protein GGE44_000987 [Rhizobium esperanzae]
MGVLLDHERHFSNASEEINRHAQVEIVTTSAFAGDFP